MFVNKIIGKKQEFAVEFKFHNRNHETELAMYVNGENILSYFKDGVWYTPCWNLDHVVSWLNGFLQSPDNDPFPVEIEDEFAAVKHMYLRKREQEDHPKESLTEKLTEWSARHRWRTAADGAILGDVFFVKNGDTVEISWNNTESEGGEIYEAKLGGVAVDRKTFDAVIAGFIAEYDKHWNEG